MRTLLKRAATALALASAITMSAPASAGPVPGNLASVGAAAPQQISDVRWRGRGRGAGVAAGIAAGIITGAIIAGAANPYYYGPGPYYYGPGPYYYDGPGYYYGPGYYDEPPAYYVPRYYRYRAPVYVEPPAVYYAPRGPRGRCWISTDKDRGFGYWGPC